jgi:hypothetical protein
MKQFVSFVQPFVTRVKAISPSCKEAVRLQGEAQKRRLPLWQRTGLRLHLLLCKWCRRYRQQLEFLRTTPHQAGAEDPCIKLPAKLSTEARERIKHQLQDRLHPR